MKTKLVVPDTAPVVTPRFIPALRVSVFALMACAVVANVVNAAVTATLSPRVNVASPLPMVSGTLIVFPLLVSVQVAFRINAADPAKTMFAPSVVVPAVVSVFVNVIVPV